MTGIPVEYLHKLVHYSTEIGGVDVKVKLLNVDYQSLIEKYINEMRSTLNTSPRVVGVDVKYFKRKTRSSKDHDPVLVLCSGVNCLIVDLLSESKSYYNTSTVISPPLLLREFLEDTSICFVIYLEVGVRYDGQEDGVSGTIELDMWNPTVLSEEQLKLVITNAYAYYKIGHKLLSSL